MDWKLFGLTFGMLFLAELGDKTQLAVFTLVSNYKNPIPIFLGASAALILVTLIGTVFGHLVTKYIPANYLQFGVGLLFLGIGIFVLKDALPDILSSFIK